MQSDRWWWTFVLSYFGHPDAQQEAEVQRGVL